MRAWIFIFSVFFLISCAKINKKENRLLNLYEQYVMSLKTYNTDLKKLKASKKLTEKIKAEIRKSYIKKKNIKREIDRLTIKLNNRVTTPVFKKIKKYRKKIRKLIMKNINLRSALKKINNVSLFFENLLLVNIK